MASGGYTQSGSRRRQRLLKKHGKNDASGESAKSANDAAGADAALPPDVRLALRCRLPILTLAAGGVPARLSASDGSRAASLQPAEVLLYIPIEILYSPIYSH